MKERTGPIARPGYRFIFTGTDNFPAGILGWPVIFPPGFGPDFIFCLLFP